MSVGGCCPRFYHILTWTLGLCILNLPWVVLISAEQGSSHRPFTASTWMLRVSSVSSEVVLPLAPSGSVVGFIEGRKKAQPLFPLRLGSQCLGEL